jgi:plasmid stabilization system protein ParE
MGRKTIKITYKRRAAISIYKFWDYIAGKGYPITAHKFIGELYEFGNSLVEFPEKYTVCRKEAWVKRNLRCVVYKKNYIFIYKIFIDELVIYNVVHARTIT